MPQSKSSSRYGFIDAIRGVAACAVMLQHSLYESGILGNWPLEKLTGFIPNQLELGETGVVAFFLVSGFVIPLSLEKTNDLFLFWIHRILRIYPLYIVIFIFTFFIRDGGGIDSVWGFFKDAAAHLLFIQEYTKEPGFVGGAWTLSLEMIWYISISFIFLLGMNLKTNFILAFCLAISAAADIVCATGHHLPMGRISMLICCVLGLVSYRFQQGQISRRHFFTLLSALSLIVLINNSFDFLFFPAAHPTASFNMVVDSWLLAGLIFFIPFFLRDSSFWNNSLLAFLGKISFSIYLVHPVILILMSFLRVHGFFLVIATFFITISTSIFSYHFFELPPIKFGHSLNKHVKKRNNEASPLLN